MHGFGRGCVYGAQDLLHERHVPVHPVHRAYRAHIREGLGVLLRDGEEDGEVSDGEDDE